MLIGILSDSHDNVPMIERAVGRFNAAECELVLHAGDLVAPFALAVLAKLSCPWKAIFGNNDGEKIGLKLKAASLGGSIQKPPLVVETGGRRIAVLHDCPDPQGAARTLSADVLIYGHTHQLLVEQPQGDGKPPLLLNPGECGGWLSGDPTVALLNTDNLEVEIIELSLQSLGNKQIDLFNQ
jgi:uncharacterized protein